MDLDERTTAKFKAETRKVVDSYGQPYTKDYIKWLEQKVVKLLPIPIVSNRTPQKRVVYFDEFQNEHLGTIIGETPSSYVVIPDDNLQIQKKWKKEFCDIV